MEENRQRNGKRKDKLRSIKHTHKDRVTRTPLKTWGELRCFGRIAVPTCSTHRVNLGTNPVMSHEWRKDPKVFTTSGTYPWSFGTQILQNGQPSHNGDRKTFEVMTSACPKGTVGSVASLFRRDYGYKLISCLGIYVYQEVVFSKSVELLLCYSWFLFYIQYTTSPTYEYHELVLIKLKLL